MSGAAGEADLIGILARAARGARRDVVLGIGDDAAILRPPPGADLALATDTLVSGIHFPAATAAADVGWKALAVNLSDLAAMGAEPAWCLLSLSLPEPDVQWVEAFAEGFAGLAAEFDVALVGGDTTGGALSVTVQVAGFLEPGTALRRDAARPGQGVYVTGTLGDAAGALALLRDGPAAGGGDEVLRARLDRPRPRVEAGRRLAGLAGACIDVSDGLAVDLARLVSASGCGADVALDRLPVSRELAARFPDADRRRALQLAGDDYELCFTADANRHEAILRLAAELDLAITRIGETHGGTGLAFTDGGAPARAPGGGWRHFGAGDG